MADSVQLSFEDSLIKDEFIADLRKRYNVTLATVSQPVWVVTKPTPDTSVLFEDGFEGPDGLITNEFAHFNPDSNRSHLDSRWDMTSGSVFRQNSRAWTGIPDGGRTPDEGSTNATHSCVFRLNTVRKYGNVKVGMDFSWKRFVESVETPAVDWDGAHIWLRYQSQFNLYYASFLRRDGKCVIKKKVPGGPSNGGTYYEISNYIPSQIPPLNLKRVEVTVKNIGKTVEIELFINGKSVVRGLDAGKGGPAITTDGSVGVRGDNAEFYFDNFKVESI